LQKAKQPPGFFTTTSHFFFPELVVPVFFDNHVLFLFVTRLVAVPEGGKKRIVTCSNLL
jgi:hypothetical protein